MAVVSNEFRTYQNQDTLITKETFHKIPWSSIAGGFFVAILSYWFLITLGVGFSAFGLKSDTVDLGTLKTLSTFGIVWTVVANALALFLGGFATLKLTRRFNRSGQRGVLLPALILASIYFTVMSMQAASVVFPAFKGFFSAVGSGSSALLQQPAVQNLLEDATAGLKIDGTNQMNLATGLGNRLIHGDSTSLRSFIASHSSMSRAEVDLRANQIQAEFRTAARNVSDATGSAMILLSWTIAITLLVGSLASWIGASLAVTKHSRVSSEMEYESVRRA